MVRPPKQVDAAFAEFLAELPPEYEELAYEFKAFCRPRKVRSPAQLMQVIMGYCGIDQVLREAAGNFTLLRERISDTAIQNRLKACGPWLKAVLQRMWPGIDKTAGYLRFVLVDGSTVQAPGAKGTSYRLHIMMNLLTLELLSVEVTDSRTGEQIDRYPLVEGDVVVGDRGYNQPARIIELSKRGVWGVVRLNPHAMPLHWRAEENAELNGQALDLYSHLKQTEENEICLPVWLGKPGMAVEGWVHARRLPADKAKEARRKCRRNGGKTPSKETLLFAGWRLILTTVPNEIMDTDMVMKLYELRWQVELLIKRLKSVLDMASLRAKQGGLLADVWLHGKLLYAVIVEKRARRQFGEHWARITERSATWWRYWKRVRRELSALIVASAYWKEEHREACQKVMQERPRKRKLQTLGEALSGLVERCQKLGVCYV